MYLLGSEKYHSDFFPLSIFCPCIILGRTQSILDNELNLDSYSQTFQMGPNGCFQCLLSGILNFCIPFPISPLFVCCLMCQRARIMDQFNIDGGLVELSKACFCSCASYQQYRFMKEIQRRKLESFSRSSLMKSLVPSNPSSK